MVKLIQKYKLKLLSLLRETLLYQGRTHQLPDQTAAVGIGNVSSMKQVAIREFVSAKTSNKRTAKRFLFASSTHLAHLELEETALLLHLFRDFSPRDLGADHSVLLGVLALLLLDLRAAGG